jgi:hypothetical protein
LVKTDVMASKDRSISRGNFIILSVIILLLIVPLFTTAQSSEKEYKKIYAQFDKEYGLDDLLVNGEVYVNKYYFANGHPFLGVDEFQKGSVIIAGKLYNDVFIKYDIYNQQVVAKVMDGAGKEKILILQRDFIDEFRFNGKIFKPQETGYHTPHFFQIIGDKAIVILIRWSKELIIPIGSVETKYNYLNNNKKLYLLVNSKAIPLKKNKNLWVLLPDKKETINEFFKSENVSLKYLSEYQLVNLVNVLQ